MIIPNYVTTKKQSQISGVYIYYMYLNIMIKSRHKKHEDI